MVTQLLDPSFISDTPQAEESDDVVIIGGKTLTIAEVIRVARHRAKMRLTDDEDVWRRVEASCDYISEAVKAGKPIYGVTSGFGGMAHVVPH